MVAPSHTPRALVFASMIVAGQGIFLFSLNSPSATSAIALAVSVSFAALLLRGSKIIWVLTALGAAGQLFGPVVNESFWIAVSGAAILFALLLPSSRYFVWSIKRPLPLSAWAEKNAVQSALSRLWWELPARLGEIFELFSTRRWIIRLAVGAVFLFFLDGALALWHEGGGDGSLFVSVLYRTVFIFAGVAQIALICVLLFAVFSYFASKDRGAVKQ